MNDELVIKEYFDRLAPVAQKMILESGWQKVVHQLSGKYNLNETETVALENEVLFTLIGFQTADECATNLQQTLQRLGYELQSLIKEIHLQILDKINNLPQEQTEETVLQKNIAKAYNKFPPLVQKIIDDSKWQDTIRIIGEKYQLHLDQGMLLENETLLVMLGLSPANEFIPNIVENANVPKDMAEKIGHDVEEGVFNEIRQALMQKTDEKSASAENITPSASPISTPTTAHYIPQQVSPAQPPIRPDLLQQKMSAITTTVTQKTDLSTKPSEPESISAPVIVAKPAHLDPYREPTE